MSDLVEYAQFNRDFLTAVQNAKKSGRTADQAAAELKLPAKWSSYMTAASTGLPIRWSARRSSAPTRTSRLRTLN